MKGWMTIISSIFELHSSILAAGIGKSLKESLLVVWQQFALLSGPKVDGSEGRAD